MKYIIIGLFIGIVSFIPGISGGTILYLSGEFKNFTTFLSNPRQYYKYIIYLLLGGLIGILGFAKIIEICFITIPNLTKLFFAYLVLCSIPLFIKKENFQFKIIPFLLASIFLFLLNYLVPTSPMIYTDINITIPFLIFFTICGFIDGFITVIPGISGSMIMMILGPYYLYKSISANVLTHPIYLIPLLFYFLGDFSGIALGAKFTTKFINKFHNISNSLILGFIVASLFIIIPLSEVISIQGFMVFFIAYILINITN